MLMMIDNYDSFSYNLFRYFEELGEEMVIFRNDEIDIEKIREISPKGIIISPGPKSPEESGICLDIIRELKGEFPILGICLGHQVIGHVFGADIIKGVEPVHGKVHEITNDGEGVFKGLPKRFKVTRYHSLKIDENSLPEELEVTSATDDGVIMGIRHRVHKIEGVQFHPEAVLTEYGHEILENFLKG